MPECPQNASVDVKEQLLPCGGNTILATCAKLMTMGECGNQDRLVNREFYPNHDRPVQQPHHCRCCTNQPVGLTLHLSLTGEQDSGTLELLHLKQDLSSNPGEGRQSFSGLTEFCSSKF